MLPIYLDIVETAFDEAGRPLRRTDQKGDTITTVYDMASRVLSGDYRLKANSPSGTIADQDTFTYDSSSRMLIGVSGRYGNTVTNTFDNAGRLSTESLTIGGQAYTVTREYDLRSQRKKVTYPNSSTWERTYTARRQLY